MVKAVCQIMVFCALGISITACGLRDSIRLKAAEEKDKIVQQMRATQIAAFEKDEQQVRSAQQPLTSGTIIPYRFAQAQLEGAWKGSACKQPMTVDVTMSSVDRGGTSESKSIQVTGVIRFSGRSEQSNGLTHEIGLKGTFFRNNGVLGMKTVALTPDSSTNEGPYVAQYRRKKVEEELQALERQYMKGLTEATQGYAFLNMTVHYQQAAQEYALGKGKVIRAEQDRIRALEAQRIAEQSEAAKKAQAEAEAAVIPVTIDMARDVNGTGWVGSIDGGPFNDCEILLVHANGVTTEKLPPITAQIALSRAMELNFNKQPVASQAYWLNIAAKDAKKEHFFVLGRLYERQGQRRSEYYARAVEYYRPIADNDARVQGSLGHLYENGLGGPPNHSEGQRLLAMAAVTNTAAEKACTSPQSRAAINSILQKEREKVRVAEKMGSKAAQIVGFGVEMDSGDIEVNKILAMDVIAIDKPFTCAVKGSRNNVSVDTSSVPDAYIMEDQYGNRWEESNGFEKATTGLAALFLENRIKNSPYITGFRIEPIGGSRYKIISNILTPPYSVTVDVR